MPERRQHQRVPYGAWVEDETQGGLGFYMAQNLSMGGLLLRTQEQPPAVGHKVRLRLVVENESRVMSVQGEVVRHTENPGEFAVHFVQLDEARTNFLRELVAEAAERHGGGEPQGERATEGEQGEGEVVLLTRRKGD